MPGNQAEEHIWLRLAAMDPDDVCRRALAVRTPDGGGYVVELFGRPVTVTPGERSLTGASAEAQWMLTKMAYFSRLSVLHYLVSARAVPPTGTLVRPTDLKVGPVYFQGSHVLPLAALAARYAEDAAGFLRQGERFGGEAQAFGDAAVRLMPFPRMPVMCVLWRRDDEFEARADLLFDAGDEQQVPADILWSIAMLCVMVMTRG